MLYRLKELDTIQSVAKHFGYDDYREFFKIMRYVGTDHTFLPGSIVEAPSRPESPRDRPYNGQAHTDQGERGKAFVEGLTMRDVNDCFRRAILQSTGSVELNAIADDGDQKAITNAIYDLVDWNDIDPIAIGQNLSCEIERMMGIFPNLPEHADG